MFNPVDLADGVSRWSSLGVTLPTSLAEAVGVFETLRYVEVGYHPVFRVEDVTPANAEDKIRELAEHLALYAPAGGTAGLSPLQRAKQQAVDASARRVLAQARAAVPAVIDALTPVFDAHARTYAEAVAKLPEDLSAETLVAAGAGAVEAYGTAQQAVAQLARIDAWAAGLPYLSGIVVRDAETVLRILRPSTRQQLSRLDKAGTTPANPTLAALDPVLFTAARSGVEFAINTPEAAAALRLALLSGVPA